MSGDPEIVKSELRGESRVSGARMVTFRRSITADPWRWRWSWRSSCWQVTNLEYTFRAGRIMHGVDPGIESFFMEEFFR